MSGCLTWLGSGPEVSLCRPAGAYRVTLRTRIRSYRGWTNRMERVITIDRPPCAAIAFNPIPPSYDCTYDFTGPQPVRDCTGLDGSRLRFTFEDLPCGFPCFTGQPQYFTAGFAFEPLRLPVRQVLIRTSANPTAAFARTEYELDELGNVLSVITYDVNGVPGVKYWYDYDHVGQPGLVSIRRDESGAPGPVQWTEAVSWRHGQVSSYRFGAGGFLSNHTLHYHYGADGQLTGVAWLDAGGNRFATFIITRASDDYKVTWQRLSSTAETTYDFTCP
jgi:hypothetical protein